MLLDVYLLIIKAKKKKKGLHTKVDIVNTELFIIKNLYTTNNFYSQDI